MTKTITLRVDQASESQLRQFAAQSLGLTIHQAAKIDTIRARIASAYDRETFDLIVQDEQMTDPVAVAPAAPQPASLSGLTPPAPVPEPYYTIQIEETGEPGGADRVPCNPGGGNRNMLIERGKPQRILHRHYHVLKNAVRTVYEQPEGQQGPMVPREVMAYPVQVLQAPTQAELDAWAKYKADLQAFEVAEKKAREMRGFRAA